MPKPIFSIEIFRQPSIVVNNTTVPDIHTESFIGSVLPAIISSNNWCYRVTWFDAKKKLLEIGKLETVEYFEKKLTLQSRSLLEFNPNDVKKM